MMTTPDGDCRSCTVAIATRAALVLVLAGCGSDDAGSGAEQTDGSADTSASSGTTDGDADGASTSAGSGATTEDGATSGDDDGQRTCTDGTDCPCDRLSDPSDPQYEPDLLFCEDFEDVVLDDGGKGWSDAYGPPSSGCFINGPDWNTNGTIEGTCDTCCINVVQEGACEAAGEDDCVLHGGQALGHRLQPGNNGGIVGNASFTQTRTFGISYALKYGSNYVDPSPAQKTNEFGEGLHCILGCATSNTSGRNVPFQAVFFTQGMANAGTGVVGVQGANDGFFNFAPDRADYDWRVTHQPGQWMCHQLHFANWGLADTTIRYWIDGQLVVHTTGLDTTNVDYDPDGIGSFAWNHYYNDGYAGTEIAYRYEDNFVITGGAEPVPCNSIGF